MGSTENSDEIAEMVAVRQYLVDYCERTNSSVTNLAHSCGISVSQVSKLIRGETTQGCTVGTLKKIARLEFNSDVTRLISAVMASKRKQKKLFDRPPESAFEFLQVIAGKVNVDSIEDVYLLLEKKSRKGRNINLLTPHEWCFHMLGCLLRLEEDALLEEEIRILSELIDSGDASRKYIQRHRQLLRNFTE